MIHQMIKKIILTALLVLFSLTSNAQLMKQKSLAELESDLKKIELSIKTTQDRIKTIRDANFLPDLYLVLAELFVDKSRYMYSIKVMKNKKTPLDEMDFANEKRPKLFAIETYQKLIEKFPNFRDRDKALFFMAHEHREMGQFEEMILTYQKLISQYPQSPFYAESLIIIGNFFFEEKKELESAIGYFKRVINLRDNPFVPLARYKLGWIYINQGKFLDSLLSFEQILTTDAKIDTSKLPEIYRKTDVKRDALVAMAWPYSEIPPVVLKKMGKNRVEPVEYFKGLSNNKISYQRALARLGRRLGVKQRYIQTTKIYFELLKMTKNVELRIEAVERLYEAMKNSLKDWPVYGYTEIVADTINQVRYSPDVAPKMKFQHDKNFEIYARDAATRAQVRARSTRSPSDYRLAISAYKAYLWAFGNGNKNGEKYSNAIRLNLAESYFNLKEFVNAGKEYEKLAKEIKVPIKRKSYLDSSIESYTAALKNPEALNRTQLAQARNGIRDVGLYYVKSYPTEGAVPSIIFNAGRSYYDERDFKGSERVLFQYITKFPNGKDAATSVDLILDAYNQREDYKGLTVAGKKIIGIKALSGSLKKMVSDIMNQSEYKNIQTSIADFSSDNYSKELLKFAEKYKGTNLGDRALFEAFNSLKSKKDPGAYIPGEELLIKHGNSKYAKEVTMEMGKLSLLTADFRRAAKYFEIYSNKYPKDPESRKLLQNAAQMRETMGDFEQARKDYLELGDRTAVARSDFSANQWSKLIGSAKSVGGMQGSYYMGIAAYRLNNIGTAQNFLRQTAANKGGSFEEKTWRAHALYLLSMEAMKQYKEIQLESGKEAQAVQAKTKILTTLTNQLNQVITSGNGRWSIAALYGLGQVNKEFADFIKRAPMPPGLTPDQVNQYKAAIAGQAKTYEANANKFFSECVKTAEKFDVFTNFVKGCQSGGQIMVDEESETQLLVSAADSTPPQTFQIRKKLYDESRNPDILLKLAQTYAEGRDYSMSVLICDRILEIQPTFAPAQALKGTNYMFMNNLELAFDAFKKAQKLSPGQPTAAWGIAALYKEFDFKSKVGSAIEKAKRSGSPSSPVHPFVRSVRL
ncbi:MAG: tetratricopeptide repeat protein [Bdellovibrionota bacterium]